MGWDANRLTGKEVLIIGTRGGIRGDGRPVALGYHTGHWEDRHADAGGGEGRSPAAAGSRLRPSSTIRATDARRGRTACSTPCRTATTRVVFRRLIRSLPTRRAVIGVATCDKAARHHDCAGLDAQTADHSGAGRGDAAADRREDAGQGTQTIGARSPITNSPCRRPPSWAVAPAARRAAGVSSSARRATRRWSPGGAGPALPHSRRWRRPGRRVAGDRPPVGARGQRAG